MVQMAGSSFRKRRSRLQRERMQIMLTYNASYDIL